MENNLEVFNFNGWELSVLIQENGDPLFLATSLANILEYRTASDAIRYLDDDEKLIRLLRVSGQNREVNFITESGLYSLVLRSRKEEAKKFKKWVTSEVLPSIRKTGKYSIAQPSLESMTPEQLLNAPKSTLFLMLSNQSLQLEEQKPKVEYYEKVLTSDRTYTTTQIAALIGKSAIWLNKQLVNMKVQYRHRHGYILFADYKDKGYEFIRTSVYEVNDVSHTRQQLEWTEKGKLFVMTMVNNKLLGK